MKKAYLYCDPRSLNDATNHYIGILADRLAVVGYCFNTVHKLSEVEHPDLLLTVTEKYFFLAKIRHPFVKHIYWSQGIGPEEQAGRILSVTYRTIAEFLAVRTSDLIFMVSYAMKDHFQRKYGYKKDNYIVMPCFNISSPEQFNESKLATPTFVYAGGISSWQCVDQTLDTYKIVEKTLPSSKLIILSKAQEEFEKKIKERCISNYEVKYVQKEKLAEELSKYKYGFLLREDNPVNNVATPTKMNGYLASHLIPIFTDAIRDFNNILEVGPYAVKVTCPFTPETVANAILAFEQQNVNTTDFKATINQIFSSYYNENHYYHIIDEAFSRF